MFSLRRIRLVTMQLQSPVRLQERLLPMRAHPRRPRVTVRGATVKMLIGSTMCWFAAVWLFFETAAVWYTMTVTTEDIALGGLAVCIGGTGAYLQCGVNQ